MRFTQDKKHRLIVLDDLITEVSSSQTIQDNFCQFCHRRNCSVIYITQNLFNQGKCSRTIALNTHYIILLKTLRNRSQIAYLSRQLFPHSSHLLEEAYDHCMQQPYSYLVIDLSPHSLDEYRVRTHIFPGEYPLIFVSSK